MDPGSARGARAPNAPTNATPPAASSLALSSRSARPRRSTAGVDYRQLAGKTPKSELQARQTPQTSRESSVTPKQGPGLVVKLKLPKGASKLSAADQADDQTPEVPGDMSRSKARNGGLKEENEEESAIYAQVMTTLKKLGAIQARQKAIIAELTELEKQVAAAEANKDEDAGPGRTKLEALYRELLKLTSEERALLCEEPHDVIRNTEILSALRSSTESSQRAAAAGGPSAPAPAPKVRKGKGSKSDIDVAVESPGPASALGGSATRIKAGLGRSGSVPVSREPKEGAAGPSKASGSAAAASAGSGSADDASGAVGAGAGAGADATGGPARPERASRLVMGAEVAYKQARPKEDGEWIQCTIIGVNDAKRTYRVQDTEPDDQGRPGGVYKATAAALIAIPPAGAALPDFATGTPVLARYPETTTFYRAEVTGMRRDSCRLKFEDDMNQEMEVDRRYVLDMAAK